MNFRLTMILAIVLVLIAAVFVWTQRPRDIGKTETELKNALLSPQPKDVRTISYARGGEVQVAFAREGGKWNLTAPVTAAAEDWQVTSIGDALRKLTYKEKFEPEPSGAKSEEMTGVKSPKSVVEFTDDAGKKHTLGLGKRTVGGVYARLDGGQTIYLLESNPLDKLDKEPSEFRSKVMAEVNTEKLTAIALMTGGRNVELSRQPGAEGKWVITKPVAARADKAVVDELLSELKQVRASEFTSMTADMSAVGLRSPVVTVTAYAEATVPGTGAATNPATAPAKMNEVVARLRLGYYTDPVQKKAVYATVGEGGVAGAQEVFTMTAETLGHLNKELKDVRDPAITPVAVAEATELSIAAGDLQNPLGFVTVKKDGAGWQIANVHVPLRAGSMEVGELLQTIANLRAIKFADNAGNLKSIGLDPPAYKISMQVPLQSQREVILIGRPETADKVTPVMRQGEPTVYLVPTAEVEKALGTALTLRDKTIERLTGDTIREIAVAGPAAKGQTLSRAGIKWKIAVEGKTAEADDVKIVGLLANFTPVAAGKWLGMDGLAKRAPDVTVSLRIAEPPPPTATGPASAPATGPASMPALPVGGAVGPANATMVTRTIKMWKLSVGAVTTWTAEYVGGSDPAWVFEPTPALIEAVTKGDYAATTQPAGTMPGMPMGGMR